MIRDHAKIYIRLSICILTLVGTSSLSVRAQEHTKEPEEIKAIFRISKQFLDNMTDKEINADIPICATVIGFRCNGVIHGRGKISIDLQRDGNQAVFSVDSQGEAHACIQGVRGPVVAKGQAWGPFTSRTLIRFNGRQFTHVSTTPCARVHGQLHRVTSRRNRLAGRVVGKVAQPLAKKMIPRAEEQGKPIAECYLQRFVEKVADRIIAKLNEKTPIEKSVNRLFPESSDWGFQMSADAQFIQAAFGPPGVELPTLPNASVPLNNSYIEVWLRSTSNEAKLLESLSKNPLAEQLLGKYLESTLPELAALAEEHSVDAVGQWVVIRIKPHLTWQ